MKVTERRREEGVLVVGPRNKQVMVYPLVETREYKSRGKQGSPTKVEVEGLS
jgi:hypothetical protein